MIERVNTLNKKTKYIFIGEHNQDGKPDGFVRVIDEFGNINEGHYTPDGQKNGFCICFNGITN